jgi:TonB family protein
MVWAESDQKARHLPCRVVVRATFGRCFVSILLWPLLWPRFAIGLEGVHLRVLQPLQLTEVSTRYAEEIVELRDFLIKAGCAVRTRQALGQIADRLLRDQAFHRDLTSHVWVVIDKCDRISYSDLLGILAIAAAGSSFAATADEGDAHCLLRFLMEARHSLDPLPDNKNRAPERGTTDVMAPPSIGPFQPARGNGQEVSVEPLQLRERDLHSPDEAQDDDSRRRGLPWVIAAGCVLVALLIGLWLKPRRTEHAGNRPASVTPATAGTTESATPSALPTDNRVARADTHSPFTRRNSLATILSPVVPSSHRTQVATPYLPSPAATVPPPVTATATHGTAPAEAPPAPVPTARPADSLTTPSLPLIRAAGTADPAMLGQPAATNSELSDASSIPQNSAPHGGDDISRASKAPTLLRRRPPGSSSATSEDGTILASEDSPSTVSVPPGVSRNGTAGATRVGTVHATSLGVMASNLMYNPMPAYPAAASASHVQGEVKLSADVDRDGHVASVRVISGPPLLRDAALDAVQRWRYRPYLTSSGPTPMAAIEILDFQLP